GRREPWTRRERRGRPVPRFPRREACPLRAPRGRRGGPRAGRDADRPRAGPWMGSGELLVVKRRFGDQITWEPRRGTMASLKRSFRLGGRDYFLARAREVGAQVSAVGPDRVYVRLAADVGNTRGEHLGGAGTLAAVGWGGVGVR